jgi:hypothetical protein
MNLCLTPTVHLGDAHTVNLFYCDQVTSVRLTYLKGCDKITQTESCPRKTKRVFTDLEKISFGEFDPTWTFGLTYNLRRKQGGQTGSLF